MKKIDSVIKFIKERMTASPIYTEHVEKWFDLMLKRSEVNILTECDPDIRKRYEEYILVERGEKSIFEFRAYCYPNLIFTIGKEDNKIPVGDEYGKSFKRDIMLNDNNETIESLSWLLLHELGHVYKTALEQYAPLFGRFIRDLNYIDAEVQTTKAGIDYFDYNDIYLTNDDVHGSRPEEVFCNMIATAIIGKSLDRHWWRENCYRKSEINERQIE